MNGVAARKPAASATSASQPGLSADPAISRVFITPCLRHQSTIWIAANGGTQ